MIKLINFVACIIAAIVCYRLATGEIDQDIVRRSQEVWFWAPAVVFGLASLLNLRQG